MADRQLIVKIIGDDRSLQQAFRRSGRAGKSFGGDMERAGRGALAASLSFRGLGRSLTFASAQFLGGAGIVFALKQVVSEASRVQEETEKTGIVFGRNAGQVQAWAKTLANSFGIAEGAALEATGRFGNMLRPLGFAPAAAAKMSEALVQLSADMASFNNTKPDVTLEALASGLAGQVRPLRQFGVFLSQARIQEEALASGIAKNASHLTQAQKVQAAYNIILKDTKLQQGDVARNTESLSVAQSKLTASIQDLEARLGKALLPSITAYVNKAAAWLSQTKNQEKIQRELTSAVGAAVGVAKALASVAGTLRDVLEPVVRLVGGLKNALIGLVTINLASRITGWIGSFTALGAGAEASRLKVLALRGALLRLAAIGVITIGVEILLNKDKIDKAVTDFLRSHNLGFATGKTIKLPTNISVADLEALRAQYKKLGSAGDVYVKALDKLIAKLREVKKANAEALGADFATAAHDRSKSITAAAAEPSTKKKGVTTSQRNQFFDAAIGRQENRVQDITSLTGQLSALQKIGSLLQARLAKTKDVTRRLKLEDDILENQRAQKSVREQIGREFSDSLTLGLNKALATAGLNDDLRALQKINDNIRKQIKETGTTVELQNQLFENQQQISATREEQRNRKQFKALGLGPTGDAIIPGVPNLTKQLGSLTARLTASGGLTPKIKKQLEGVRKVLSGEFGKVTAAARAKIQELFQTIRQGFDKGATPLSGTLKKSFKDVFGDVSGLSADQVRRLRADFSRVSQVGGRTAAAAGAGAGGLTVTVQSPDVFLDGKRVSDATRRHNQVRARRNPPQKRGPQAGHR